MIVLLTIALLSWLILGMLFPAFPTIKRLKPMRKDLPWVMTVPIYVAFVLGLAADVAFNWLIGTVIFREFPREFVFTDRLKRHKTNPRAQKWIKIVNLIDPGHV